MRKLNTPFYLTGGTALGRHYLHHRYSDVIDLFVNDDPLFESYVNSVIDALNNNSSIMGWSLLPDSFIKAKDYVQLNLSPGNDPSVVLKIDLVNDIAAHSGGLENSPHLGLVDGWWNILTNKITALFRFEAKDYADIWAISRRFAFTWSDAIAEARKKEGGLDPSLAAESIRTIPRELLREVKWASDVDYNMMRKDLDRIALDTLEGGKNSLKI